MLAPGWCGEGILRTLAIITTLALAAFCAAPASAQNTQDKNNRGGLGGVLDTLGNVLGTGSQKLHGTVVVSEDSTFVLRTDDGRTYRVDTASLDPQKTHTLTQGQAVLVTARGGGQAGVLTASDIQADAKSSAKAESFRTVSGSVQEASRDRVLFKTRDGLVLPIDVSNINGLPYLAANQPATLYYEQGAKQQIVGVWIQPATAAAQQPNADRRTSPQPNTDRRTSQQPNTDRRTSQQPSTDRDTSPSASVPSAQSLDGVVESLGVSQLTLQTSAGHAVTVDTSGVDRQALRAIAPGDNVTVTGKPGAAADRFVASSIERR